MIHSVRRATARRGSRPRPLPCGRAGGAHVPPRPLTPAFVCGRAAGTRYPCLAPCGPGHRQGGFTTAKPWPRPGGCYHRV